MGERGFDTDRQEGRDEGFMAWIKGMDGMGWGFRLAPESGGVNPATVMETASIDSGLRRNDG